MNGWRTWETWNYILWNDGSIADDARDMLEACEDDKDDAREKLAAHLEAEAYEHAPELSSSFYADALAASIREIDFHEIAETFLSDL